MNNYRNEILNEFIDRYEKSSYYKGKSEKPRKISIVLHKKFPEYGHSFHYEETNELENIAFQLQSQGFVEFSIKSILGDRELILNQEENCLDRIYKELKRVPVKEKIIHYVKLLDQYHEEAFIKDFVDEMKKRAIHQQSLLPYLKVYDENDLENVMKILKGMIDQKDEISFRRFSEKVLGDTKKLEKYKNKIVHIIKDFYDDTLDNENDIFEAFYIRKNPAYVYLKGNAILQINGQIINLNEMHYYFVLPSICIKDLKIKRIDAKQVMTIENLTSFHDVSLKDTFYIFTNGFHNHAIEAFLKCLYDFLGESVHYFHFGDIDAGGFHIYESLIKKTQIPFQMYKMNIEMLKKYKDYTKPLTQNDRKRLLSFKENQNELIDYMLKNNVKLEQEIIGENENERKDINTY